MTRLQAFTLVSLSLITAAVKPTPLVPEFIKLN
jgi:hypothetical protein